jgi:hypothetical protein
MTNTATFPLPGAVPGHPRIRIRISPEMCSGVRVSEAGNIVLLPASLHSDDSSIVIPRRASMRRRRNGDTLSSQLMLNDHLITVH